MAATIQYFGLSDIGKKRKDNQDCFICNEKSGLFAISDGMGGLCYGKETAQEVIRLLDTFVSFENFHELDFQESETLLKHMLIEINTLIIDMGNEENMLPLYGATLTGFLLLDPYVIIFNVGDSRVYGLKENHSLKQLTSDDNLLKCILNAHIALEEEEMKQASHVLLQYMGMVPTISPFVQIYTLHEGDILCACSDGLSGMLSDLEIERVLRKSASAETKAKELVLQANCAGGEDNITVIVLEKGRG